MGALDGIKYDNNEKIVQNIVFQIFILLIIYYINKNLRFILHPAQYSDQLKIENDVLSRDKDKIEINPKSIMKRDSTGAAQGTIIVDSDDKLKFNYNSDFYTDYNGTIWCNLGPGLERNSDNKISISLAG